MASGVSRSPPRRLRQRKHGPGIVPGWRHRMEILLDVIVAGLVAGGVAGGIVLAGRSRTPRHAPAGAAALPIQPSQLGSERAEEGGEASPATLAVAVDPASRAAARDEIDA